MSIIRNALLFTSLNILLGLNFNSVIVGSLANDKPEDLKTTHFAIISIQLKLI